MSDDKAAVFVIDDDQSIREALRVFLTEHETRRCMAEIEELTREGHPSVAAAGGL